MSYALPGSPIRPVPDVNVSSQLSASKTIRVSESSPLVSLSFALGAKPPSLEKQRELEQEWSASVGRDPIDSAMSVVVPVRNEVEQLPWFFDQLTRWDIPSSVELQLVVVTNDCSDESAIVTKNTFEKAAQILGERSSPVDLDDLPPAFSRDVLDSIKVSSGKLTLIWVDLKTPGKSRALWLANSFARAAGHVVCVSVDCDVKVEPDAPVKLFRSCLQTDSEGVRPAIVKTRQILLTSEMETPLNRVRVRHGSARYYLPPMLMVSGPFMGWDVSWMNSIGGPPQCPLMDYGLGVIARSMGRSVVEADDAVYHQVDVGSLKDKFRQGRRFVRARLELLDRISPRHGPVVCEKMRSLLREEGYSLQPLHLRVKPHLRRLLTHPLEILKTLGAFALNEYVIFTGRRDYYRDAGNPSWEPCISSKQTF